MGKKTYKKWEGIINRKVTETIHPELYADVVLKYTKDVDRAEKTKKNVMLAARYVLWFDLYYETKKDDYYSLGQLEKKKLFSILNDQQKKQFGHIYNRIKIFWQYEENTAKNKAEFTKKKRAEYLHKKSSDVFLYCAATGESRLFTKKIIRSIHSLQQLNDIYDDFIDTKEDRKTDSPNLVFLFSWKYRYPKDLSASEKIEVKNTVKDLLKKIRESTFDLPRITNFAQQYKDNIFAMLK